MERVLFRETWGELKKIRTNEYVAVMRENSIEYGFTPTDQELNSWSANF